MPLLPFVEIALSIDGAVTATGSTVLDEAVYPASTECVGGVELYSHSPAGISLGRPAFVTGAPGASSAMISPEALRFNPGDPRADGGEMTKRWRGTLTIVEWTADWISLALSDGELCDEPSGTNCTPADGALDLTGTRRGYPIEAGPDSPSYQDVASGSLVCSSDLP